MIVVVNRKIPGFLSVCVFTLIGPTYNQHRGIARQAITTTTNNNFAAARLTSSTQGNSGWCVAVLLSPVQSRDVFFAPPSQWGGLDLLANIKVSARAQ